MKPIKLELKEKARKNVVYLAVKFEGGDADTEHWEEHILKGLTFNNVQVSSHTTVNQEVEKYRILKNLLDDNDISYEDIEKEHGKEMARMYNEAPNDPQCDYQFKCYLDSVILRAYDENGDRYEAYLL